MGLFDDHVGVWCGTHVVIDGHGREIDRFEATVTCRREGDRWLQTTTRAWNVAAAAWQNATARSSSAVARYTIGVPADQSSAISRATLINKIKRYSIDR